MKKNLPTICIKMAAFGTKNVHKVEESMRICDLFLICQTRQYTFLRYCSLKIETPEKKIDKMS